MISSERLALWRAARNILAVRLDGMGDLIMTTPAFRALGADGARVTALTSPSGAEAARLVPELDAVIEYTAPWMKAPGHQGPAGLARLADDLRNRNFDAAVIFSLHTQSALPAATACFLAGIPLRAARCRENPYGLLTDWVKETESEPPRLHDVRRQLELCAELGAHAEDERLSLAVPQAAREAVRQELPAGPWAVLHPGASAPSRRYPLEQFGAAARQLVDERGWSFVITGSMAERDLAGRLTALAGPGAKLAIGRPLAELAALIEAAPLLITNNTGPAHIAAAVGTPVVDLYALTNPQHTPWMVPNRVLSHDVPCRCCYRSVCPEGHHACLREIPPRRVSEAALELTAGREPTVGPEVSLA